MPCHRPDSWELEHVGHVESYAELLAQIAQQMDRKQRVPADIKETVVESNSGAVQQATPGSSDGLLEIGQKERTSSAPHRCATEA